MLLQDSNRKLRLGVLDEFNEDFAYISSDVGKDNATQRISFRCDSLSAIYFNDHDLFKSFSRIFQIISGSWNTHTTKPGKWRARTRRSFTAEFVGVMKGNVEPVAGINKVIIRKPFFKSSFRVKVLSNTFETICFHCKEIYIEELPTNEFYNKSSKQYQDLSKYLRPSDNLFIGPPELLY
jgi:hypothetical protein